MIFESFSVILRQISLGVHSYAVVHFPCLTKKSFKNRDFGSFRRYCVKFRSEYIRTPSLIFLVLRKNPSKIEILGLFGDTASNFARSTDSTPSFIFLVLRKNPSKIETLGLFGDAATNITRSTFARCRSFSLSYEKILQKSRFGSFRRYCVKFHSEYRQYAVVYFPCLTKKSFKNRDFWVFAVTLGQISLGVHSHAVVYFPTERPSV